MGDGAATDADAISRRREAVRGGDGDHQDDEWRRGLIGGGGGPGRRFSPPGLQGHGQSWNQRHWSSRTLHRLGEATAHATAGFIAALAVVLWAGVGLAAGFPDWWETVLYSTTSVVTLVMVFAIQHTQSRQQSATQRKLDELLRSHPDADNEVIAVEEAPDDELAARARLNHADRDDGAAPPPPG